MMKEYGVWIAGSIGGFVVAMLRGVILRRVLRRRKR